MGEKICCETDTDEAAEQADGYKRRMQRFMYIKVPSPWHHRSCTPAFLVWLTSQVSQLMQQHPKRVGVSRIIRSRNLHRVVLYMATSTSFPIMPCTQHANACTVTLEPGPNMNNQKTGGKGIADANLASLLPYTLYDMPRLHNNTFH